MRRRNASCLFPTFMAVHDGIAVNTALVPVSRRSLRRHMVASLCFVNFNHHFVQSDVVWGETCTAVRVGAEQAERRIRR